MSEVSNYENYVKQVIDGKIYYMSPGTAIHAMTISKLTYEFQKYLESKKKGCIAISEGIEVFLDGEKKENYVVPDISIICDKSRISKRGYEGAPELIAEVLSPSTAKVDKKEKLLAYEKAKVKEYWIVSTKEESIEQYVLKNDKYVLENIVILMSDIEFNKLTDNQKEKYTSKIKSEIFKDLEIDLNGIFDFFKD